MNASSLSVRTRREFLKNAGIVTLVAAAPPALISAVSRTYKAAIIGRTGGGDYGHGYDQIFSGIPNVIVTAVADPDPAGRAKAAERSGAKHQYADYQEMLEKEKPNLVSIASRHPDCHVSMALAAMSSGAHLFIEKPFTEWPDQADQVLKAAEQKNIKIVLAHNRRYSSDFLKIQEHLRQRFLGELREVRFEGKQDSRAGGEDMMVLGTHDFDLARFFFGDPAWCFADIRQNGHEITPADAHKANEPIWVAGDQIKAQFDFPRTHVYWTSLKLPDHWNTNFSKREKWSFEISGSKGRIYYQSGLGVAWLNSPFPAFKAGESAWTDLPDPKDWKPQEHASHMGKDLIWAIENDKQPICSGYDGRWAIEMNSAVYQSALSQKRVTFPLKTRGNPFVG